MRILWEVVSAAAVFWAFTARFPATASAQSGPEESSGTPQIRIDDPLPFGQSPVNYHDSEFDDAVVELNVRLSAGKAKLTHEPLQGYLPAALKLLSVPVESQLLVYSKTARNQRLIDPQTPRAVYFNDEVSVAWVPAAEALEISAIDPHKGGVFYVLSQRKRETPLFERSENCLACHAGSTTLSIPGFMIRSFLVDRTGKPIEGYSQVTHDLPITKRWGGWFVTGTHRGMMHMGNLINKHDNSEHKIDPAYHGNMTDVSSLVDLDVYPSRHSDIVAHMVLAHQAHGQNLLIRVNFESRLKRKSDAETRLLRYLFFADEALLSGPIIGTSGYQKWFERQGPHDREGRSLRLFDLQTRLFRYRLSYLVYSRLFENLPSDIKSRLYRKMWGVLNENVPSRNWPQIPAKERVAIVEILRATKSDLPEYWFDDN